MVRLCFPPKIIQLLVKRWFKELDKTLFFFNPMDSFDGPFYWNYPKIFTFGPSTFLTMLTHSSIKLLAWLANIKGFIIDFVDSNVNEMVCVTCSPSHLKRMISNTSPSFFEIQKFANFTCTLVTNLIYYYLLKSLVRRLFYISSRK